MFAKRLIFEKLSPAVYYSHLDLMRCFERAIRRAAIPIWYTEGFNPRPFLSFAQPLSLGTSGENEALDIRLCTEMRNEDLIQKLNKALPDGVRIKEAFEPICKAGEISAARYIVKALYSGCSAEEAAVKLRAFLAADMINAGKKNKKKQCVIIDIKPMIYSASVECGGERVILVCTLACGGEKNLNPSLLFSAFTEASSLPEPELSICRTALLMKDGHEFC